MKRKGKIVQKWDMEGLDNYGASRLFNDTLAGDFTNLDKNQEELKADRRAIELIDNGL